MINPLVEKFNLMPITTPEKDLAPMLPVRTNLLTTNELFTGERESFGGCSRGPVVNVYVQDRDPVSPFRNRERARRGGIAGTLWNQGKTMTPGQMPQSSGHVPQFSPSTPH